ncbi:MAG: hypothetical protein F9K24_20405 [Leptonema illini]|uniref:Phage tail assembly protein n=1 Tax=Leptonema illini TaxID=183 RepID=A0A833LZE0_9LEPT|nr:MAG: hypothetical protein F9K24_20405 [Leptonema illini]
MGLLQTEFEFELPNGYLDPESGKLEKDGIMRLSTAADELLPMRDPRVQQNPAYAAVILLSRVIVRIGSITQVTPRVVESLFTADFGYLQDMYNRINGGSASSVQARCPACDHDFTIEVPSPGEA